MLMGYQGKTSTLKVLETGDDGLDGLNYSFSDGAVQYAFAKVTDTKTNLPKFVFISYAGEGAQQHRKGAMHTHMDDITKVLHGAHVQVHARTEDDIEPASIMEKVSKASGSYYTAQTSGVNQAFSEVKKPSAASKASARPTPQPKPVP
ncbi:hypothetical protein SARC_15403, partial [Sphaeroforma arctica JP610]